MRTNIFTICLTLIPFLLSAQIPCDSNYSCQNAKRIYLSEDNAQTCVSGCNVGMEAVSLYCCRSYKSFPTAFFRFNTGSYIHTSIEISNSDLPNPIVVLLDKNCYAVKDCFEGESMVNSAEDYIIAVTDTTGHTGNFEFCITMSEPITSECITDESLEVVNTNQGSPLDGPFLPGETLTFEYTVKFVSVGNCQWLHSIIPYMSDCWGNQIPVITEYPVGTSAANMKWYPAGATHWKPLTDNPPSSFGITDDGKLCKIGTQGCNKFTLGVGGCGDQTGTPMPAGWVVTNYSGTCSSDDPNQSWGIPQGCSTSDIKKMRFQITIPGDISTSCINDPAGLLMGIGTFADGGTGGWQDPRCNGNQMLRRQILVNTSSSRKTLSANDGLRIYPNPASDVINLTWNNSLVIPASATVYSVNGSTTYTVKLNSNDQHNASFDSSALAQGAYVLKVKTNEGVFSKKIVIK